MTQHFCSQANRTVKVVLAEVESKSQEMFAGDFAWKLEGECVICMWILVFVFWGRICTDVDGVRRMVRVKERLFFSCACCGLFSLKWLVLSSETVSSTCQIEASKCLCSWEDTVQRHQQSHDIIVSRQLVISYPREMVRKSTFCNFCIPF